MSEIMGEGKRRAMERTPAPSPITDGENTREIPAVPEGNEPPANDKPGAAPAEVVPNEETVPVQSCIERSLLHEILRRESAERDK